jgi:hypothetical protein
LQAYPDLVDGVALDSVVSPSVQHLSQFDELFDPVAKPLAELCAQDAVCGEKLGADPWARVLGLLDKLDQGHCPAFLYRSIVLPGFTQLLMDRELRAHIPASPLRSSAHPISTRTRRRMLRCSLGRRRPWKASTCTCSTSSRSRSGHSRNL